MRIRKFVAATMRDAVEEVKRELGPEAMIVATRNIRRGLLGSGVEVTAAIDIDEPAREAETTSEVPAPASTALSEADVERFILPLRSELRSLKAMIRPLAERPANESPRLEQELRQEIAALRRAIETRRGGEAPTPLAELTGQGKLAAPSQNRIIALVGPTGVGKTTTIAKLAARSALIEKRSVAILTLDNYRVGGEAQIRAFADLMGVPVTVVNDPNRLRSVVDNFARYQRIYIDTAGRSPRDASAIALLERALGTVDNIEVHLTIAAATQASRIDEWFHRYRALGIDRLLFTKVDEAGEIEELVRAPARLGRPVSFLTTGQRVPEDLEDATNERMLELATIGMGLQEVAA